VQARDHLTFPFRTWPLDLTWVLDEFSFVWVLYQNFHVNDIAEKLLLWSDWHVTCSHNDIAEKLLLSSDWHVTCSHNDIAEKLITLR
jgi:hypothetical protein